jgi:hypothetical protein
MYRVDLHCLILQDTVVTLYTTLFNIRRLHFFCVLFLRAARGSLVANTLC